MQRGSLICKLVTDSLCKGSVRVETCFESELAGCGNCFECRNGQGSQVSWMTSVALSWHPLTNPWKAGADMHAHTLQDYPKSASRIFFSSSFTKSSWGVVLRKYKTRFEHPQTHLFVHLFINNIRGESWLPQSGAELLSIMSCGW